MATELENIQKILKMKLLKKDYDRKRHNPLKDDFEKEESTFNEYFY
jgi:hypothetical protein